MGIEPLLVLLMALLAEYVGVTFGVGYGTMLAPILLLMGFSPLQIIPGILLSQIITGIFGSYLHHGAGNVSFNFNNDSEHRFVKRLGKLGYIPRSKDSKVALVLGICSIAGVIVAVLVALNLPVFYLKLYIGILVTAIGITVTMKHSSKSSFSWKRIIGVGVLASFNKGISGGGYRPLLVSGQILSGVNTKSSIAITSLAEGVTCFVGVLIYFIIGTQIDWMLAPYLVIGSLIAVPLTVYSVKKMPVKEYTFMIGMAITLLGILTLIKSIV